MKLSKYLCLKGRKEGGNAGSSLKIVVLYPFFLGILCHQLLAQGANPFEIQSGRTPVRTENSVRSAERDSLISSVSGQVSNPKKRAKFRDSISSNPFEVDHIPIPVTIQSHSKEKIDTGSKQSSAPLLWLLLFSCALLAIAMNFQIKYFKSIYQSILNLNKLMLFHREAVGKLNIASFLYYVVFSIQVAIFIAFTANRISTADQLSFIGKFTLAVGGLYLFRHIFLFIFGRIFLVSRASSLYSFTIMVFNMFTGILLIPFNFLMAFGPEGMQHILLITAIFLISIILLLRFFRGLLFLTEFLPDRFFQIILYLCTLEIAPVLILIKTVSQGGLNF